MSFAPSVEGNMDKSVDQVFRGLREEVVKATSLSQALTITGVKLRRHVEGVAIANCPFPAHTLRSPSFMVRLSQPEYFSCDVCGASGGLRAYIDAFCAAPSETLRPEQFITTTLRSRISTTQAVGIQTEKNTEYEIASDRQAFEVYDSLVSELDLLDYHQEYLAERGLSVNLCFQNGYRSLPASRTKRIAVCEYLVACGYCLEGVPGFFRIPDYVLDAKLSGRWCVGGDEFGRRTFKGKAGDERLRYEVGGILIPVRDANFRITRFEILNDLPPSDAPETLKVLWPPRSSLFTWHGSNCSRLADIARLHHVGPLGGGEEFAGAIWVTDGALRADILSAVFGARALGVTRSDCLWEETVRAISDYNKVIIAISHKEILYPARLCREARRLGIESFIASWEREEAFDFYELRLPNDHWAPISYDKWWSGQRSDVRDQIEAQLSTLK